MDTDDACSSAAQALSACCSDEGFAGAAFSGAGTRFPELESPIADIEALLTQLKAVYDLKLTQEQLDSVRLKATGDLHNFE